jgi:hypothetical protein
MHLFLDIRVFLSWVLEYCEAQFCWHVWASVGVGMPMEMRKPRPAKAIKALTIAPSTFMICTEDVTTKWHKQLGSPNQNGPLGVERGQHLTKLWLQLLEGSFKLTDKDKVDVEAGRMEMTRPPTEAASCRDLSIGERFLISCSCRFGRPRHPTFPRSSRSPVSKLLPASI